jgi:hypothetical protein
LTEKSGDRRFSTYYINKYYEIATLLEMVALGDILDSVAPYNVSTIPNNWFTKTFFPFYSGMTISNRIISSIQKLMLEDVP